jgi:hypothetical protein
MLGTGLEGFRRLPREHCGPFLGPAMLCKLSILMVGARGFEPPTSWSRTKRSSQAEPRPDGNELTLYHAGGAAPRCRQGYERSSVCGRSRRHSRSVATARWLLVSVWSGLTEIRPERTAKMSDSSSLTQSSRPSSIQ